MSERLAKIISLVFHPIFVPIYGILAIANFHFIVSSKLNAQPGYVLILAFSIVLSIMPLFGIMFLLKKYTVAKLSAINKEERSKAAFSLCVIYAFIAWRFDTFFIHSILRIFVIALAASSAVLAFVSRYEKVSFHVFAWAGMLVLTTVLALSNNPTFIFWVFGILCVTGIVAASRLKLKAHTHRQVYLGFFLGLICNIAVYLILDGRI